jgi:hypothetical protein
MDFCNCLQMVFARVFVICAQSDFSLARRMMRENPHLHTGPASS